MHKVMHPSPGKVWMPGILPNAQKKKATTEVVA